MSLLGYKTSRELSIPLNSPYNTPLENPLYNPFKEFRLKLMCTPKPYPDCLASHGDAKKKGLGFRA